MRVSESQNTYSPAVRCSDILVIRVYGKVFPIVQPGDSIHLNTGLGIRLNSSRFPHVCKNLVL